MTKVLITDGLAEEGIGILKSQPELQVDVRRGIPPEELKKIIGDYDALIVRSATNVTADIIDVANGLKVIGRAGIGVDNVDVEAATRKGIAVMNTPEANAITTAEHTLALMLALARKIPQAHSSLISGRWEKGKFKGRELSGKTLGIIGLGNIGRIVAERAKGLKMKVIAYDPFLSQDAAAKLGVELVSFDELLKRSEVITTHTPLTSETKNLIGKEAFSKMKKGVLIINCARGGIVDEADLYEAIKEGKVGGAALDVFEPEPPEKDNPLFSLEQVVFTPHLGASTEEAQTKVGIAIAEQIVDFFLNGTVRNAVNMPSISLELLKVMKPYLALCEKLGKFQGQLCRNGIDEVYIEYSGEVANLNLVPLTVAAIKGLLDPILDIPVNYVNAPVIARERRIRVVESRTSRSEDFTSLISIKVKTKLQEKIVAGTIFGKEEPRFVRVNGFSLDAIPKGHVLVIENYDKPGAIGMMGTLLGKRNINIARMHLGRESIEGRAIAFINVDSRVPKEVIEELSGLPQIISVIQVEF